MRKTEAEQRRLKDELFAAGLRFGYTRHEIKGEWELVVNAVTRHLTDWFKKRYSHLIIGGVLQNTDEAIDALDSAADEGIGELVKIIRMRTSKQGTWTVNLHGNFPLTNDGVSIYVYRQRVHSQEGNGRKVYKIGKTQRPHQRDKEHKTSNTDLELLAVYPESGILNETEIHRHLRKFRLDGAKEWFLLNDEQAKTVCNPHMIKIELLK